MPEMTNEYRLTKIEERVSENESRNSKAHKEFYDGETDRKIFESNMAERCGACNKDIEKLKSIAMDYTIFKEKTEDRYFNVENSLRSIALDVKELKEKPVKRWDNLIKIIITAVTTGIISYLFGTMSTLV